MRIPYHLFIFIVAINALKQARTRNITHYCVRLRSDARLESAGQQIRYET